MSGEALDDERLQLLLAKQEIHDALMRYCRGADRCDLELVLTAFHDDAVDNHMGFEVPAAESMRNLLAMDQAGVTCTNHVIGNEFVEVDGDVAGSESYFVAYHRITPEGRQLDWTVGGRYIDRFERRDGAWRIAHRTVVYDWQRFDEVMPPPADLRLAGIELAHVLDHAVWGERGSSDTSYQVLPSQD